jgi:hypothetical protein
MHLVPHKEYRSKMKMGRQKYWYRKESGKLKTTIAPIEVPTECVVLNDHQFKIYQAL